MSLTISVRDYRGVERADIELASLALVAGVNEAGKSCLAEAARAVLAGEPIPISGVAKKDAKLLVRDGAESGRVSVEDDGGARVVEWPQCSMKGHGTGHAASEFAVGLQHLLNLDDRTRPKVLAAYIGSQPTEQDLASAMTDAGYGDKAISQVWQMITGSDGWDGAYKRARDYTARTKGQWEGVTGEKYGSKKAEGWIPKRFDEELADAERDQLVAAIAEAKAAHERAVGRVAVSEAHLDALRDKAATVADLERWESDTEGEVKEASDALRDLQRKRLPEVPQQPMACPKCDAALKIDGDALVEVTKPPTKAQITKAEKALSKHNKALAAAEDAYASASYKLRESGRQLAAAIDARNELAAHEQKQADGEASSEADIEAARTRVEAAETRLRLRQAWESAHRLHGDIQQNEKLVGILATDGLRQRKLATGIKSFNERLTNLCAAANWPTVRFDESLQAHYGTRPVWAASRSGQWRARVVIQVAMALIDGSAAVVIDEADILDARGRNSLFALLNAAKRPALVCMTISRPELVPDLAAVGMGASYWIADGVAEPIVQAQERAA